MNGSCVQGMVKLEPIDACISLSNLCLLKTGRRAITSSWPDEYRAPSALLA